MIIIIIIMKNFNRRSSHGHQTHTWIARICSHACINTITTMLCEAPAQLLWMAVVIWLYDGRNICYFIAHKIIPVPFISSC